MTDVERSQVTFLEPLGCRSGYFWVECCVSNGGKLRGRASEGLVMFLWPFRRGFKNSEAQKIYNHLLGAVVDDEKQFYMPEKEMLRLCRASK